MAISESITTRDQLYIGGAVGRPRRRGHHRGAQPRHRAGHRPHPRGHRRRRRRAPSPRPAPPSTTWSQTHVEQRAGYLRRDRRRAAASARTRSPTLIATELGMPITLAEADPGRPADRDVRLDGAADRASIAVRGDGRQLARRARADRRRRRDHAVELPAAPDRREGRARARRRLHGRAQAERGHAAQRVRARRDHRRGRRCPPASSTSSPAPARSSARRSPRHPGVDMVSFTGSTRAGRRVSELAAATVKKVALELGGKSPNVILDDADLETRGRRRRRRSAS